MSWMRLLLRRYAIELESKKDAGGLGHSMVPAPAFRASSFVLPTRVCWPQLFEGERKCNDNHDDIHGMKYRHGHIFVIRFDLRMP